MATGLQSSARRFVRWSWIAYTGVALALFAVPAQAEVSVVSPTESIEPEQRKLFFNFRRPEDARIDGYMLHLVGPDEDNPGRTVVTRVDLGRIQPPANWGGFFWLALPQHASYLAHLSSYVKHGTALIASAPSNSMRIPARSSGSRAPGSSLHSWEADVEGWNGAQGTAVRTETGLVYEGIGALRATVGSASTGNTYRLFAAQDWTRKSVRLRVFIDSNSRLSANDGLRIILADDAVGTNYGYWYFGTNDGLAAGWNTLVFDPRTRPAARSNGSGYTRGRVGNVNVHFNVVSPTANTFIVLDEFELVADPSGPSQPPQPSTPPATYVDPSLSLHSWNAGVESFNSALGTSLKHERSLVDEGSGALRATASGASTGNTYRLFAPEDWTGKWLRLRVFIDHPSRISSNDGVRIILADDAFGSNYGYWYFGSNDGLKVGWNTILFDPNTRTPNSTAGRGYTPGRVGNINIHFNVVNPAANAFIVVDDLRLIEPGAYLIAPPQHWWRLGQDAALPGRDYGMRPMHAHGPVDVQANADGSYVQLDGASHGLTTVSAPLGVAADWTLSAWIRPDRLSGEQTVFEATNASGTNSIRLSLSGAVLRARLTNASGQTFVDVSRVAPELSVGRWTQIAVVSDGGRVVFFVDGSLRPASGYAVSGSQTDTPRSIRIGRDSQSGTRFQGAIASPTLWDIAFDVAQMQQSYALGEQR